MKKIVLIILSLVITTISFSQVITFELDEIQLFKCPSNLSINEASRLDKLEYFDLNKIRKHVWTIDLTQNKFKVGKEIITIISSDSNSNEKCIYIEFLDPKGELHKLAIGTETGTNKDIVIVTKLDKDPNYKKGYFGYPINLKTKF
jgi:hypothetical protein